MDSCLLQLILNFYPCLQHFSHTNQMWDQNQISETGKPRTNYLPSHTLCACPFKRANQKENWATNPVVCIPHMSFFFTNTAINPANPRRVLLSLLCIDFLSTHSNGRSIQGLVRNLCAGAFCNGRVVSNISPATGRRNAAYPTHPGVIQVLCKTITTGHFF